MSVSASVKLLLRSYSRVQADLHTRIFFVYGVKKSVMRD